MESGLAGGLQPESSNWELRGGGLAGDKQRLGHGFKLS